jgi:hypothetical protein
VCQDEKSDLRQSLKQWLLFTNIYDDMHQAESRSISHLQPALDAFSIFVMPTFNVMLLLVFIWFYAGYQIIFFNH